MVRDRAGKQKGAKMAHKFIKKPDPWVADTGKVAKGCKEDDPMEPTADPVAVVERHAAFRADLWMGRWPGGRGT